MNAFDYRRATTIDEVSGQLDDATRPLAGGTDLLTLLKHDVMAPSTLIDIKQMRGIDAEIRSDGDGLTIGALATLASIERHPAIRERYRALTDAAGLAASPQIRNRATIGGNLLQRPRCWYFRSSHITCWLKGGDTCYARDGENQLHALFDVSPCVAVHPSDPAAALIALDAEVTLQGANGERRIGVETFFAPPTEERRTETIIAPDEIVRAIHLPGTTRSSIYLKAMDRQVWAFALVGVAAALERENGTIRAARLVLSGVAPVPVRIEAAEVALAGQAPGAALFRETAKLALAEAHPLAKNSYKVPLATTLIERALAACVA